MDDTDELVEVLAAGGWCAPEVPPRDGASDCMAELRAGIDDHLIGVYERLWNVKSADSLAVVAGLVSPCDGVNHRWERMTSFCHECNQAVPPRRLECEACDAELREDADGLPAGHFDRLWAVAPAC